MKKPLSTVIIAGILFAHAAQAGIPDDQIYQSLSKQYEEADRELAKLIAALQAIEKENKTQTRQRHYNWLKEQETFAQKMLAHIKVSLENRATILNT